MTTNENELKTSQATDIHVGLANALKNLREQKQLSIEQVAIKLNLAPKIITDIECCLEDVIESKKYSLVFLRGYLTNYSKLVGLENIESYNESLQISNSKKDEKTFTETAGVQPRKRKRRVVLKLFILIVLAALVGVTYNFLSGSPDDLVNVDKQDAATVPVTSVEKKQEEVIAIQEGGVKNASVEKPVAPIPVEPINVKPVAEPINVEPVVEPINVEPVAEPIKAGKKVVTKSEFSALRFTYKADWWTEIFDAKGKCVAYGLYKRGRVINVKGKTPFKVKLGDPTLVTMLQDGKAVSHKFKAGKMARFTLPL